MQLYKNSNENFKGTIRFFPVASSRSLREKMAMFAFLAASTALSAQVLTEEKALESSLKNHPIQKAAAADLESIRQKAKAAHGLENPEINVESPTGEFYAIGASQSFDWPTVYKKRQNLAKAEVSAAEAALLMSQNELRFAVRSAFLAVQKADFEAVLAARRDSLFQKIGATAAREFVAGQIDFLQKTMVEKEAATARQSLAFSNSKRAAARAELAALTGLSNIEKVAILAADAAFLAEKMSAEKVASNPSALFGERSAAVAAQQTEVEKAQNLPRFSVGYLNQAAQNSPVGYRFRASVGVPIWAAQSRAKSRSAEAASLAAAARSEAEHLQIGLQIEKTNTEMAAALDFLTFFEKEIQPKNRELLTAAQRMREAGQLDYAAFLRILDAVFESENERGERLEMLEAARARLLFLIGE